MTEIEYIAGLVDTLANKFGEFRSQMAVYAMRGIARDDEDLLEQIRMEMINAINSYHDSVVGGYLVFEEASSVPDSVWESEVMLLKAKEEKK